MGMGNTFVTVWTFVGYMGSAAIVGAALVAIERKFAWRPSPWPGVLLLFAAFACIDSYWFPLAYAVDLACTMDVAPLNGPPEVGPVRIPDLFAPDAWDAIAWIGQVVVATHVAQWLGTAAAAGRELSS